MDANTSDWTIKLKKLTFDGNKYSDFSATLLMESSGITLPESAYNKLFSPFLEKHKECRATADSVECDATESELDAFPRFVLKFEDDKVFIHPRSYCQKIQEGKYKANVRKSVDSDLVVIGADALNRVYVIFHASGKVVGFVKYTSFLYD